MSESAKKPNWRLFWSLFVVGWGLFAFLAATNGQMVTPVSPGGILDHQVAGTAARVDEIQGAWAAAGTLTFARLSMGVDLLFIGVLSIAGVTGGVAVARAARGPILRAIGWLAAAAFLIFCGTDYTETLSQFTQAWSQGIEPLARLAKTVNPPKVLAFLAGHGLLFAGLLGVMVLRKRT
jgi:hypothetical protein